jgi:hypothetical protein
MQVAAVHSDAHRPPPTRRADAIVLRHQQHHWQVGFYRDGIGQSAGPCELRRPRIN